MSRNYVLWHIRRKELRNKKLAQDKIILQNMPKQWYALLLGLFALLLTNVTSSKPSSPSELFTSSFLVRFKRSVDNHVAHEIAQRHGFHNIGEVGFILSRIYVLFYIQNEYLMAPFFCGLIEGSK